MAKRTGKYPPIHPGETLREDFLRPLGLSASRLAADLQVPATRIQDILRERRPINADTALRLARYFGTSGQFWINLQGNHDLAVAEDAAGAEIQTKVKPRRAA